MYFGLRSTRACTKRNDRRYMDIRPLDSESYVSTGAQKVRKRLNLPKEADAGYNQQSQTYERNFSFRSTRYLLFHSVTVAIIHVDKLWTRSRTRHIELLSREPRQIKKPRERGKRSNMASMKRSKNESHQA